MKKLLIIAAILSLNFGFSNNIENSNETKESIKDIRNGYECCTKEASSGSLENGNRIRVVVTKCVRGEGPTYYNQACAFAQAGANHTLTSIESSPTHVLTID